MNRAKVWGWRLLVAVAAVLFASLMLVSYLQILGYIFDGDLEAMYREWEAASRAEGDLAQSLRWKEHADLASWSKFRGRLGIAACLSSLAAFVAAVLVKRRSSRPAAVRAAAFLTRAMSLGFWLSAAALILIYATLIAFLLLTDD